MDVIASIITKKLHKNSVEYIGGSDEEEDDLVVRVVKPNFNDEINKI